MIRFRNFLPGVVATLVGTAALWAPAPAQASYSVQVFDDGAPPGGLRATRLGNSLAFAGSTTHFSLSNGSGPSTTPGSQSSNLQLSSNEQITTTFGGAGGTHSIEIVLSQTGFTAPTGTPLMLSSSAGGSISDQGGTQTVTSTYQGFLDNTNTLFGKPGAGSTPSQSASASLTATGTANLVYSPEPSVSSVPGGTPFSMTDDLKFTFTIGAGSGQDTANASVNTVATSVPEPSTMAIAGLGALGMIGYGLRRRKALGV